MIAKIMNAVFKLRMNIEKFDGMICTFPMYVAKINYIILRLNV